MAKFIQIYIHLPIPPRYQGLNPFPADIFKKRSRAGILEERGGSVKNHYIDQYFRYIGHILAALGGNDPQNKLLGKLGFWLVHQISAYMN